MSVQVLAPGLLTTVQDTGRHGLRHLGVGCAGALDAYSLQIANLLVANDADAAALEITLAGPRLRCERAVRIALCGAEIDAHADDLALPGWRPIDLPAGSELMIGHCRRGARAYLAIAPDWWAVRLGANRPQLLILYAIKFKDGTWDKPQVRAVYSILEQV